MKDHLIDLRSDTVTRPGQAMLAAMTTAEVGDDVWGDDPTVKRLQDALAERTGTYLSSRKEMIAWGASGVRKSDR